MYFNFKGFLEFTYQVIKRGSSPYRSAIRWFLIIIFFYILYPLWQVVIWAGLFLDKILFPKYRDIEMKEPIFIIGNPRSATTFLHRLLSKDTDNFSTIKTWEIFASPSITSRHIITKFSLLDKLIGSPINKLLRKIDIFLQNQKYTKLHKSPFWETEEDDNLFLHIWSSLKVWIAAGLLKKGYKYIYFDKKMPLKDKDRIFRFYLECLKRHIYFHKAQNKRYLSKSPYFSPKISTLQKYFPDAKFIYLVRNPQDMVPSYMNLLHSAWDLMGEKPENNQRYNEYIIKMTKHWYEHPLENLDELPSNKYLIIKTKDIAKDPEKVIRKIHSKLDLEISDNFLEIIRSTTKAYQERKRARKYSLKNIGFTKKMFFPRFRKTFSRFNFKWQKVR